MGWFNKKQESQETTQEVREYDPRYYEEIDVCAADTVRPHERRYLRDKRTQQIVGRVVYQSPTRREGR